MITASQRACRCDVHPTQLQLKIGHGWFCKEHIKNLSAEPSFVEGWDGADKWCGSRRWVEITTSGQVVVYDENNHTSNCCKPKPKQVSNMQEIVKRAKENPSATPLRLLHTMAKESIDAGDPGPAIQLFKSVGDHQDGRQLRYAVEKGRKLGRQPAGENLLKLLQKMEDHGVYFLQHKQCDVGVDADFVYYFLIEGNCKGKRPRALKDGCSQIELLLQCQKGGRLYNSGIALDDSHGKIDNYLVVGAHTFDDKLGRILDLAYLVIRRDGAQHLMKKDSPSSVVYEVFMKCLIAVAQQYLGANTWKSHYARVIVDAAGEIQAGGTKALHDHDPNFYKIDNDGKLLNMMSIDDYHYKKSMSEIQRCMPEKEQVVWQRALRTMEQCLYATTFIKAFQDIRGSLGRLASGPLVGLHHIIRVLAFWMRRYNHVWGPWAHTKGKQEHSVAEPAHHMWQERGLVGLGLMEGVKALLMVALEQRERLRSALEWGTVRKGVLQEQQKALRLGKGSSRVVEEMWMQVMLMLDGVDEPINMASILWGIGGDCNTPTISHEDPHTPKMNRSNMEQDNAEDMLRKTLESQENGMSTEHCEHLPCWPANTIVVGSCRYNQVGKRMGDRSDQDVMSWFPRMKEDALGRQILTLFVESDDQPIWEQGGASLEALKKMLHSQMVVTRKVLVVEVPTSSEEGQSKVTLTLSMHPSCSMCGAGPCVHLICFCVKNLGLCSDTSWLKQKYWTLNEVVVVLNRKLVVQQGAGDEVDNSVGSPLSKDSGQGAEAKRPVESSDPKQGEKRQRTGSTSESNKGSREPQGGGSGGRGRGRGKGDGGPRGKGQPQGNNSTKSSGKGRGNSNGKGTGKNSGPTKNKKQRASYGHQQTTWVLKKYNGDSPTTCAGEVLWHMHLV